MITYTVKVDEFGDKVWYLNGKRHREDGPAIEYADGYKAWYLNGKEVTEQQVMNTHSVIIDGKEVTLSRESFDSLKEFFKGK